MAPPANARGPGRRGQRWRYYGGKCWICTAPADTLDHVKPKSKGGPNFPSNLRPCCRLCNVAKGSMWPLTPRLLNTIRARRNLLAKRERARLKAALRIQPQYGMCARCKNYEKLLVIPELVSEQRPGIYNTYNHYLALVKHQCPGDRLRPQSPKRFHRMLELQAVRAKNEVQAPEPHRYLQKAGDVVGIAIPTVVDFANRLASFYAAALAAAEQRRLRKVLPELTRQGLKGTTSA